MRSSSGLLPLVPGNPEEAEGLVVLLWAMTPIPYSLIFGILPIV